MPVNQLIPGIPNDYTLEYIWEYWGKSAISDAVMNNINEAINN